MSGKAVVLDSSPERRASPRRSILEVLPDHQERRHFAKASSFSEHEVVEPFLDRRISPAFPWTMLPQQKEWTRFAVSIALAGLLVVATKSSMNRLLSFTRLLSPLAGPTSAPLYRWQGFHRLAR